MRLARWMIVLWLILAALIGGAMGIGRVAGKPNQVQALGFDTCDGKPCIFGVRPGMRLARAQVILRLHSHRAIRDVRSMRRYNQGVGATVNADNLGRQVNEIRIVLNGSNIQLGHFVAFYGVPCKVLVIESKDLDDRKYISLIYPNILLGISQVDGKIDMESTINSISLVNSNEYFCRDAWRTTIDDQRQDYVASWIGFTNIDHYVEVAQE